MKTLLLIILVLLSLNCYSQDTFRLDRKNGFKGFILGDNISKFKGIIRLNKTTGCYEVTKRLKVDRADLRKVVLNFQDDLLKYILVFVKGQESVNHIHNELVKAYGDGVEKHDEENVRHVEWAGRRVMAVYTKSIVVGDLSGVLSIYTYSTNEIKINPNEVFDGDL